MTATHGSFDETGEFSRNAAAVAPVPKRKAQALRNMKVFMTATALPCLFLRCLSCPPPPAQQRKISFGRRFSIKAPHVETLASLPEKLSSVAPFTGLPAKRGRPVL